MHDIITLSDMMSDDKWLFSARCDIFAIHYNKKQFSDHGDRLAAIIIVIYRKNPKISDTRKFAVITLKVE